MKLNNKGFTVVELLASFTLSMIIVVFLFEIVLQLKDTYLNVTLKTQTLSKLDIITDKIYALFDNEIIGVVSCPSTDPDYNTNNGLCLIVNGTEKIVFANSSNDVNTTVKVGNTRTVFANEIVFNNMTIEQTLSGAVGTYSKPNIFKISGTISALNLNEDIPINIVINY